MANGAFVYVLPRERRARGQRHPLLPKGQTRRTEIQKGLTKHANVDHFSDCIDF
jgi:hypothetical protein